MRKSLLIVLTFLFTATYAQDDLEGLFGEDETTNYAFATFKSSRIIIGESVEQTAAGNLIFDIQHQFGAFNTGFNNFYGLDQALMRLGFIYGITDWMAVGIGRTNLEKTYDASLKIKVLRQSTGKRNIPFTLSYFGDIAVNSLPWADNIQYYFSHRLTYTNQILIARKFSSKVSAQLTPTVIHRNLVATQQDENDVYGLGFGGRLKLTNRLSVNGEYFLVLSQKAAADYHNSLSLSLDIETGGHIFQLYFSNSYGMLAQQFVPETEGDWLGGDIHFGFNLSRTFVTRKPKEFRE